MENNDKGLVEQFMIYLYEKKKGGFLFYGFHDFL